MTKRPCTTVDEADDPFMTSLNFKCPDLPSELTSILGTASNLMQDRVARISAVTAADKMEAKYDKKFEAVEADIGSIKSEVASIRELLANPRTFATATTTPAPSSAGASSSGDAPVGRDANPSMLSFNGDCQIKFADSIEAIAKELKHELSRAKPGSGAKDYEAEPDRDGLVRKLGQELKG